MIIKHERHIFWEIHEMRKGLWAFFLIVLFARWLAEQANSDHVIGCMEMSYSAGWREEISATDLRNEYTRLVDTERMAGVIWTAHDTEA